LDQTFENGYVTFCPHRSISKADDESGDTLARRLLEAAPMAEELEKEYLMLNAAVHKRDLASWTKWDAEFDAWMSGDRSGWCPFETKEVATRM
jgi:hypothetical protein